jgi:biofilm PGA synthesis N-glycosyltransferase PgaC
LGFWQTVFSHGFWPSSFWLALSFFVFEGIYSAVVFIIFPVTLVLILFGYGLNLPYQFELLIKGVIIGDYILTIIAAFAENRFSFLFYGLGFLILRFVDSVAYI